MIGDTLRRFFAAQRIERGPLVVAVSGGVDSTALLVAMAELGSLDLVAAHVNHHLRGVESDEDEQFVRTLCDRLGVELRVADGTLDPEAVRRRGVEAAAREVRHARLHEIAAEAGASYIATAHQKNDQAETVLMRLITGAGVAALRGIHPVRDDGVIRPLLEATRADIDRYLAERGIVPRLDRSNTDPRFLRNRVRTLLREFDPGVIDDLVALAEQARRQWPIIERAIDAAEDAAVAPEETRFRSMPGEPWLRQALLHRHIRRLDPDSRDVSARDLARLAGELQSVERVSVTKSLELVRRGNELVLRRVRDPVPRFEVELTPDREVFIPEIATTVRLRKATAHGERRTATSQLLQLPSGAEPRFTVRNRRDGDRFQPLGLRYEKKLKDVLIDRKIAAELRDRIPLLLWNGTIAWVAGVEVSEAFKVTAGDADRYEVVIETEEDPEGVQREADRETRDGAGRKNPR